MAAVTPGTERIDGVNPNDVVDLDAGNGRPVKRVTVSELLHYGWEDLRFPAAAINPLGATSPPALDDTVTGFPGTLLFSGSQENIVAGVAQMPHAWEPGTTIKPHIHWSKPVGSADAVTWELYYRHLGFPSDVAWDWVGPLAGTISAGDQTVANAHIISGFADIDMAGKRESSMLCWQIRRQGATDADNGTARLLEFDIHYYSVKAGTATPIPPPA